MAIDMNMSGGKLDVDILFVSDLHIGSEFFRAEQFTRMLDHINPKRLIINGDGLDGHRLHRHGWNIPEEQRQALDCIYEKEAQGVQVDWVNGNHDEVLRKSLLGGKPIMGQKAFGMNFSDGVMVRTDDNREYLVTHGDYIVDDGLFENDVMSHLPAIGDFLYDNLQRLDQFVYDHSPDCLKDRFSVAASLKSLTKVIIMGLSGFNRHALKAARDTNVDGIIYGHTHMPGDTVLEKDGEQVHLLNSGSWVDSCTAIVMKDGEFDILWGRQFDRIIHQTAEDFAAGVERRRSLYRHKTEGFLNYFKQVLFEPEKKGPKGLEPSMPVADPLGMEPAPLGAE